jgi:subtilisin family serine protease
MASPHVAGVAALYKQVNPSASSTTVRNAIVNGATTNVVTNAGSGSPNRLLYSLFF